ncbi:MAG: 50S ribosomal protein L17 [Candidatus Curtissbacteria bacterium]
MRHKVFGKKLSRDINSRKALASNLSSSLLVEGHITTTLAKAKFVRSYAEKLITNSRRTDLHTRRSIASGLTHQAFIKLITEIGPGFESRPGGYTRIVKLTSRRGDDAPMARIEILDWDKSKTLILPKTAKPTKKVKASAKTKADPIKVTKEKNEKPKAK